MTVIQAIDCDKTRNITEKTKIFLKITGPTHDDCPALPFNNSARVVDKTEKIGSELVRRATVVGCM